MGSRRRFTPEYRRDVASLVLDTGSTIASVARDLGLGESVVGRWVTGRVQLSVYPSFCLKGLMHDE